MQDSRETIAELYDGVDYFDLGPREREIVCILVKAGYLCKTKSGIIQNIS